ncbi:hypothetical protein SAMN04489725_1253 [Alicyclobacillus hesperidum]|uniref:Uncharacterized protein n=1 Tax=Alicyclobacillus hesperidum TaxID=89784 RepID=A0A1H2XVZ1_9BACL|nr:hypothetical protein [Alicyclobacillus hesperidum]SDW97122.1 hypothetical protein SAMN04489725_1253 [Alicyclobacillus hesperidum]
MYALVMGVASSVIPLLSTIQTPTPNQASVVNEELGIIRSIDSQLEKQNATSDLANQQNYLLSLQEESQSPQFQKQLTQSWLSSHGYSTEALNTSNPNGISIPVGSINVVTTYSAGTNIYWDDTTSKWAADLSIAYTIADDIASYWMGTVGGIVNNVANLVMVPLTASQPVSSQLYHTYSYGYKNVYVYTGGSWWLALTLEDREWYRHAVVSYVPQGSTAAFGTVYNYVPSNGYGPFHVDYSYYWNDQSEMDQIAEQDYQEGIYRVYSWT